MLPKVNEISSSSAATGGSSSSSSTGGSSLSSSTASSNSGLGGSSMFDEIRDAIDYLLRFLYDKVPRRKVSVFGEQYANFLVLKYHDHWDSNEPRKDAEYRCIKINQPDGTNDSNLTAAASAAGLDSREVLQLLPANLELWVNPGEVLSRQANGPLCPVVGPHSSTGRSCASNTSSNRGYNTGIDQQPTAPISPLKLSMSGQATSTNWLVADSSGSTPVFEASAPQDAMFTAGEFSKTRFGSTKIKSDPVKTRTSLISKAKGAVGQHSAAAAAAASSSSDDEHQARAQKVDAKLLGVQPPSPFRQQQQQQAVRNLPAPPQAFAVEDSSKSPPDRRGRPILGMQHGR